MSIVVEGYSGCGIRVLKDERTPGEPRWVLEKTSSSASYVPRLHKQIDKQVQFKKLVEMLGKRIVVPEVLYRRSVTVEGVDPNSAPTVQSVTVGMAFEHHTDCITFLGKASQPRIEVFLAQLLDVFQTNIDASPITELPKAVFVEKLIDVKRVCLKNAILADYLKEVDVMVDKLIALFDAQPTHAMPLGRCHGDLTLSNLLVQEHHEDRLVLIDFLDSFVETPLADMAKICQDLYYGWTLRQQTRGYDRTRLFTIFRLFRDRLFALYAAHPWFKTYFRPMLLINQMRVLQYSKNNEDALYLLETCRHQYKLWQQDAAAAA